MRRGAWILALCLAASAAGAGEVTITLAQGRVSLAATTTPVSDVLDQLARKTGMKVIYDGAPPRLLVSPRVERESATQAVLAVLEGLGLSYVLITDASANRVDTLFVASGVGAKAAATPPRAPGHEEPQEKPRPPMDDEDEEPVRPMPPPQEPEPPKPIPVPQPAPTYSLSPFATQPPPGPQPFLPGQPGQPFIPGITPPPGAPGQPYIPGLTPPSPPPPQ